QLIAVFQSPLVGLTFHVALPAKALLAAESKSGKTVANRKTRALRRRCEGINRLIWLRKSELRKFRIIFIAITSVCANEPRTFAVSRAGRGSGGALSGEAPNELSAKSSCLSPRDSVNTIFQGMKTFT